MFYLFKFGCLFVCLGLMANQCKFGNVVSNTTFLANIKGLMF